MNDSSLFYGVTFEGPPPTGYDSWSRWVDDAYKIGPLYGVTIRADDPSATYPVPKVVKPYHSRSLKWCLVFYGILFTAALVAFRWVLSMHNVLP